MTLREEGKEREMGFYHDIRKAQINTRCHTESTPFLFMTNGKIFHEESLLTKHMPSCVLATYYS